MATRSTPEFERKSFRDDPKATDEMDIEGDDPAFVYKSFFGLEDGQTLEEDPTFNEKDFAPSDRATARKLWAVFQRPPDEGTKRNVEDRLDKLRNRKT